MPATSKAQQRLFGIAYAVKVGDLPRSKADKRALELADNLTIKELLKFAKTDHDGLPDKVKEMVTPANIGGMGALSFPSNFSGAADGSGDVPAGRGDAEEEYKKKKKEREEQKKRKNETMIFTDFNSFLNEEYQPNGKYNTVAKVRKKLGPRASEKTVAEFIIANLKDVTGIGPKELRDGYKTDQALDKVADIAAFYKFDDIEWNTAFQDAINNAPYDWEVDYNFESVNEGEISDTFDLILDTINKYKKIKPVKPYFNAAKRMALKSKGLENLEDIRDHLDKTLKDFTVTKISKGDNYPSQESFRVINKNRKIYSITMDLNEPGEFDITYSDLNESRSVEVGDFIKTEYGYYYKRVPGKVGGQEAFVEVMNGKVKKRKTSLHSSTKFEVVPPPDDLKETVNEAKAPFEYNLGYKGQRGEKPYWKYAEVIGNKVKDIEGIRDYHKQQARGGRTAVQDISNRILIGTYGQPDIKDDIVRALKGVDPNLDLSTIKNNYDASDYSRSKNDQDKDKWEWEIQKKEDYHSWEKKYGGKPKQDTEFTHDHQMRFIDMLAPYSTTQHQLADIQITSLEDFLQYASDHVSAANLKKVTKRIKKEYPKLESANYINQKSFIKTWESFVNERRGATSTEFTKPGNDGDIYFSKREGNSVAIRKGDKLQSIYVYNDEPKFGKIHKSDKRWENMGKPSEKLLIDLKLKNVGGLITRDDATEAGRILFNFVSQMEAKARDAREDLGYVSFLKDMGEINAKDLQRAYQSAVNVLVNEKGMTEKQAVGFLNSPHGKYMAEYLIPGQDYSYEAFLDKLDEYYNERMLGKLAKDFQKLG